MLKNILVGYDDSRSARAALQQALDIAEAAPAWIHLVHAEEAVGADAELLLLSEPGPVEAALAAAEAGIETEPDAPPDTEQALDAAVEVCHNANVPCTSRQVFGRAGEKLAQMSRLYNLLVVGESSEPKRGQRHHIGSNLRHLLRHCPIPLMVCAHNYHALDAAMLIYRDDAAGGRALSLAGELCSTLNIPLKIAVVEMAPEHQDRIAAELKNALKAFHVESELQALDRSGAEVVPLATVEWAARCVIMSYAPAIWPWAPSAVRTAMGTPNLVRFIVP